MDIADWFHAIRSDRGLTLSDLSALSIAPSQISRVENKQSDLTLLMAVKIAYALNVSILEIVRGLGLQKDLLDLLVLQTAPRNPSLPTIQDIEKLIYWYSLRPIEAKQFLYKAFGEIRFMSGFENSQNISKSWDLVKVAIEPVGTNFIPLPYPTGITTDLIQENLLSQGILTFFDLGIFIRQTRRHYQLNLSEIAEKIGMSYSALRRVETGDIERVKVEDIFALDEVLGNHGAILAVAWRVGEFYSGVIRNHGELKPLKVWSDQELALAETLIAISRWYQVYSQALDWLRPLRDSS